MLPELRQNFARSPFNLLVCLLAFIFISNNYVAAQADVDTGRLKKEAQKAMRLGEFERAEKLWSEILAEKPDNHESRLGLSYALYKQRRWVETYNEAEKVKAAQPKNPRALALIGAAYLAAGNFIRAEEYLNAAIFLNDEEPLALANSAMLDFHENRSVDGFAKLRRAIFLETREPDFYYYLAQVAGRLERYKEAANAYEKFLQIAPVTDEDRRSRILGLIDFLRYLGVQKNLYQQAGKTQTTVACQIVNNRPVIPVKINNSKETLRFVLDSGSGISVISDETAERMGLNPIARGGKARAIGGGGKFEIVYGFLNTLEIGEAKINKVPVYIRKFYQNENKVDGYIGINLLSKYLTTVDYPNKYFSLIKLKKENGEEAENKSTQNSVNDFSIPLRITSSGFLSGEVKLDGIAEYLNFIVDTGASVSVVNHDVVEFYQLTRFAETTLLRVYGAAGVTENVTALILPRVNFGTNAQNKLQAAVLDLSSINETAGFQQNGILGGNFLRNYRVTFDFRKTRMLLEETRPASQKTLTDAVISE